MSGARDLRLDLARATIVARRIVNHHPSLGALPVRQTDVQALAHSFCALLDAAAPGAAFLIAREGDLNASYSVTDLATLEVAGRMHDETLIEFADDLVALGLLGMDSANNPTDPEKSNGTAG